MSRSARATNSFALAAMLALIAGGGRPLWGAPSLELELEPKSATVGDRIGVQLTLRLDPGDRRTPSFPEPGSSWGELAVIAASPPQRVEAPSGVVWRGTVVVAAFRTGPIRLPPLEVSLGGAGETPLQLASAGPVELEIRSVLPPEGEVEPMGAEPPRALPVSPAFAWTAGVLALAAVAAIVAARRKRTVLAATTPVRAPWPELAAALDDISAAEPAAGHAALSVALRRYLGRRLDLRALEATTTELAQRLLDKAVDSDLVRASRRLLRELDQVKFARRPTSSEELTRRVSEARELAGTLERTLQPQPPDTAA